MGIQSLNRAIDILELFSGSRTHISISEMSAALKLNVSTVHGLVSTLVERRFLSQDPQTRHYSLGLKIFELNHYFLGCSKIYQFGASPAHRLAKRTGLNVRLAVRDEYLIVVILEIFAGPEKFQYFRVGPKIEAYFTSMGKAVLAFLTEEELSNYLKQTRLNAYTQHTITDQKRLKEDLMKSRQQGYAIDREESLLGAYCVGAPIFDQSGTVCAAVSISSGPGLLDTDKFSDYTDQLIQTSLEISYFLGYRPTFNRVSSSNK